MTGEYSIADIANFAWIRIYFWTGIEIDDLPNLKAWLDRVAARPAVERGVAVPVPPDRVPGDDVVKGARTMLQR